jgi:hypothetical protein
MNEMLRKILSVIGVGTIAIGSFVVWAAIELNFDGCCGARSDPNNNEVQGLVHLAAYAAAVAGIWLLLRWGWKKPKQ